MNRISLLAGLALALAAAAVPVRSAHADVRYGGLDPTGYVSQGGDYALISGPVYCDAGDLYFVTAVLSQAGVASVSQGMNVGMCQGTVAHWTMRVAPVDVLQQLHAGGASVCLTFLSGPAGGVLDRPVEHCQVVSLLGTGEDDQAAPAPVSESSQPVSGRATG